MSTKMYALLISVSHGTPLFAQVPEILVEPTDAELFKLRHEVGLMPPTQTKLFRLHSEGNKPLLTVDVRLIVGSYWGECRPSPQDRVSAAIEKTVNNEREGDEWKDSG